MLPPELPSEIDSDSDDSTSAELLSLVSLSVSFPDEMSSVETVDDGDSSLLLVLGFGLLLVALLDVEFDSVPLEISDEISVSVLSFSEESASIVVFDVSMSDEPLSILPSNLT